MSTARFSFNLSIKALGLTISILLAVLAVSVVGSSMLTIGKVDGVADAWARFEGGPAKKAAYVNDLYSAIGYGGMIHQFKNYVLRQDHKRIAKAEAKAALAFAALQAIATLNDELAKSRENSADAVFTATTSAESFLKGVTATVAVALTFLVGLVFWFTRYRLVAALVQLRDAMAELASGNAAVEVPDT